MHLVWIFAGTIGLFLVFVGWGSLLKRVVRFEPPVDWGLLAAWGMALTVILGGFLNLLQVISRPLLHVYIGIGLLSLAVTLRPYRVGGQRIPRAAKSLFRGNRLLSLGVLLLAGYITFGVLAAGKRGFNQHDDYQTYLVFPEKMIQAGCLGPDPFSDGRLKTGLGGQSFLHALVISFLPIGYVHIIERGVAYLIAVSLAIGHTATCNLPALRRLFVLFAVLLLLRAAPPYANISSVMTGVALFYALARTAYQSADGNGAWRHTLLLAVIAAGVMPLKSNHIPSVVAILFLVYLFTIVRERTAGSLCRAAIACIIVVACVAPWMTAMYESSGTLLYPLLGDGFHGSVYGSYPAATSDLTTSRALNLAKRASFNPYVLASVLLGACLVVDRTRTWHKRSIILAVVVGAVAGFMAMMLVSRGIARYGFPALFGITLFALIECMAFRRAPAPSHVRRIQLVVASVAAVFLVGRLWSRADFGDWREAVERLSRPPLSFRKHAPPMLRMQAAIPAGAVVLARVSRPFLFDFKRNLVYAMDHPGAVSPPPGLPQESGPGILADYLLSQSIRYVAYSYKDQAGYPKGKYDYRLRSKHPGRRAITMNTYAFQDNLLALASIRNKVFDDARMFVLDLATPADSEFTPGAQAVGEEAWIEAEWFQDANARVDWTVHGVGIGVILRGGKQVTYAEYVLDVANAGAYELSVRYAANQSRPVSVIVNGERTDVRLGEETTGGWGPESQEWFSAGTLRLEQGLNRLRLEGARVWPHIDRLKLARMSVGG